MKGNLTPERFRDLNLLCRELGLSLEKLTLLHQALTHSSCANECKAQKVPHNERLEFLGDAVLELVISEYLFTAFSHFSEGELTKTRAQIVCEPTLAKLANQINLGTYLLLGKGEELSGGRFRASILADAFEAVIGSVYLAKGFDVAKAFILHQFREILSSAGNKQVMQDYKTLLQEFVQRNGETKLLYEVIKETGPDHDKQFEIAVVLGENRLGVGSGRSKKEAEQAAACQALVKLNAT